MINRIQQKTFIDLTNIQNMPSKRVKNLIEKLLVRMSKYSASFNTIKYIRGHLPVKRNTCQKQPPEVFL